ncbi:phosphatidylethanolamine N-methyltransferase [Chytriomyces hyalinus]|nr:phosphatidylethanolamine N-methyltransferase [Chytriomyces hyalinus]
MSDESSLQRLVDQSLTRKRGARNGLQEPIHDADLANLMVGRTRSGAVFPIPPVNSLLHSLLFPACIFDWTILTLIAANLVLLLLFGTPKTMFLALFVAWRIAYNLAIGILLRLQCDYNWLTRLAKKYGFAPNAGKKRGQWQSYLVAEVMKKLDLDEAEFNASNLPVEFTTWILFRALVDCVLVNDFLSHTLFSIAYFKAPTHDGVGPEVFGIGWKDWLRYSVGCVLLLVNYGIKIEGNRAVSDYAWYWGDFFFFQTNESVAPNQSSHTTDSNEPFSPQPPAAAFELAPHPMYSVGYVGFYAAALIAKSYTVFFVSLVAHLAQIGFFFFVESHHFERTYGPPGADSNLTENLQSLFRRDLLMFKNFDLFRSTDVLTMLVWILTLINACIVGRVGDDHDASWKVWFYVGQALFWRFIYSGVLGYVLHLQSKYTFWSRHFIKFGETAFDAFRHWKIIYNLCQSMTYISFFLCAFMLYKLPSDWLVGTVMLKHTIALILILLHIWTTFSIHKTLGEYGWFFGDFFIDSLTASKASSPTMQIPLSTGSRGPTYTGLYRFLNHPNAWAAAASAWGVTVVTGSPHVLLVTIISQICGWCFVFLVEAPHMRRRYGNLLRSQSLVDEILPVSGSTGSFGEGYQEFAYVRNVRGSLTSMRGLRRRIGGGSGALGSRRVMGGTSDGAGGSPLRSNSSTGSFSRVAEWREQMRLHSMSSSDAGGEGAESPPGYAFEDEGLMMKDSSGVQHHSDDVDDLSRGSDGDDEDEHGFSSNSDIAVNATTYGANFRGVQQGGGVGMSRSFSNPGRVSNFTSQDRLSSSFDASAFAQLGTKHHSGSAMSKNMSSGSLKRVSTVVKDAVNHAKPRVDMIVNEARNIVKTNVEKFAGSHWSQTQQLPRHLYSVSFPDTSSYSFISSTTTPRFQLGAPITIQFQCVRETLKRRDWIGIYPVGDNLSTEVTTSKSFSRWMFLTATVKNNDDDAAIPLMTKIPLGYQNPATSANPPSVVAVTADRSRAATSSLTTEQNLLFGNTVVKVRPSDEDQGLRIVTGTLLFRRSKIPWQVGKYEARYQYDGGYSVVTISQPFEIVAECFQWVDVAAEDVENEIVRIEDFLLGYVELSVDIDVGKGDAPLDANEDILARVSMDEWIEDLHQFRKYKENVAKRIVYGIKRIFGIEFSWHVVGFAGTVKHLARRIFEAKQALSPSPVPFAEVASAELVDGNVY